MVGSPVALDRTEVLANRFSSWTPSTRESWHGLDHNEDEGRGAEDVEEESEETLVMEMEKLMVSPVL